MEKEEDNIISLTGYRGEMTKPIVNMDAEELKVWEREINQKNRKNLFAKKYAFCT